MYVCMYVYIYIYIYIYIYYISMIRVKIQTIFTVDTCIKKKSNEKWRKFGIGLPYISVLSKPSMSTKCRMSFLTPNVTCGKLRITVYTEM
jgi:hypothetical protein